MNDQRIDLAGVNFFAQPGAAPYAQGKRLVVVGYADAAETDDRVISVELDVLSAGQYSLQPFATPDLDVTWLGKTYTGRSGMLEILEGGSGDGDTVHLRLTNLDLRDGCGTALAARTIELTGDVEHTLGEILPGFADHANDSWGYINAQLDGYFGSLDYFGPIGGQPDSNEPHTLLAMSEFFCDPDLRFEFQIGVPGVVAGVYTLNNGLRQTVQVNPRLYLWNYSSDGRLVSDFRAASGQLLIEQDPSLQLGAVMTASVVAATLNKYDDSTGRYTDQVNTITISQAQVRLLNATLSR